MSLRAVSVDFHSKWSGLSEVCSKVIRCQDISRDKWSSSFSDLYALCVSRPESHAPRLYDETAILIKERVLEILAHFNSLSNDSLLESYVENWTLFHRGLGYLDNLYSYLNREYVRTIRPNEADICYGSSTHILTQSKMEILEMGLTMWKSYLIDSIQSRITSCLLIEVEKDREGIICHQNCIALTLDSFKRVGELKEITKQSVMDIYPTLFEGPLLDQTRIFYNRCSLKNDSEMSCKEYTSYALSLLYDEMERAKKYYEASIRPLELLFQDIFVQQKLDYLNASIPDLIKNENKIALKNLYKLLSLTNQCSELLKWFGLHIKSLVSQSIDGVPDEFNSGSIHFVDSLIVVRDRFVEFIDEVFDGVSSFRNEMDKAFSMAINNKVEASLTRNYIRPAEYLSRYMDTLLRRSHKQISLSELESKLTTSITIFKYIEEKDVFQKYYQRNLCRRLIFMSGGFLEMEELAINQLKVVCGSEFTSKFQRMFNDIQLASEVNNNFQIYLAQRDVKFKFALHFNILTQSSWPISTTNALDFTMPVDLLRCMSHFEDFYKSVFHGRKMHWVHSYSTVELKLCFTDKPYILQLVTDYAAVLLLFDMLNVDELSVQSIITNLQLTTDRTSKEKLEEPNSKIASDDQMEVDSTAELHPSTSQEPTQLAVSEVDEGITRMLTPLIDVNILQIKTNASSGEPPRLLKDSILVINYGYSNKRLKFKVTSGPQIKEPSQDVEQVDRQVEDDRRFFTQAAIVRIMKERKVCKHGMLLNLVIDMAKNRFQPSVPLVKRSIENLIERGFIERCPTYPDQYNYLA